MDLKIIKEKFAIFQLENYDNIDFNQEYMFTAKTRDEYSVICPESIAPKEYIKMEMGWKCFCIAEDAGLYKLKQIKRTVV